MRDHHLMTLFGERLLEQLGHAPIVFGDQNLHRPRSYQGKLKGD
jgi:hypothetical protein